MAPFLLFGTRARSQTSQVSLEGRRATSSRSLLPRSLLTRLISLRQSSFPICLVAPEAVAVVVEMGVVVGIGVVVDVRIGVGE